MAAKVITFADFSGGEYGLMGAQHARANMFTGQNVVMLHDGSLCPRSGLKNLGYTGVPTGEVRGFGYNVGQSKLWFIISNHTYDVGTSVGAAVRTLTGAFASTVTARIRSTAEDDVNTFITSLGDKSYQLVHSTGDMLALTGSPGGRACALYGVRMVASGSTVGHSSRIFYSAAGDFNSWPVANYFDVGSGYEILGLVPHRDRITIIKHDGSWWALTGTPGVNDVLRRMQRSIRPGDGDNGITRWSMSGDGKIWFLPQVGEYPSVFNGSTAQVVAEHLSMTEMGDTAPADSGFTPTAGVATLLEPEDVFFCTGNGGVSSDNQGLLFTNGMWTRHHFEADISGWVDGRDFSQRRVYICDGGGTSVEPTFYVWTYRPDRPPFASKSGESIGDDSSTPIAASFTTPEWWSKDGSEVRVGSVIVDFRKWDHGFDADNAFTVTLTPTRKDGGSAADAGGTGTAVTVGTFSEDPSEASTSGTVDRRRWSLPTSTNFANGFQLTISGMVGVAIQKVHAVCDFRPIQGA